jgi:hypothetical protein
MFDNNRQQKKKNKFAPGDSYSFDIAEYEYDNQIALSPTNTKEERIKLKTIFVIKK